MSNNRTIVGKCPLCGCFIYKGGNDYAKDTKEGREHASEHHFVAQRFFGINQNEEGETRTPIFTENPFDVNENETMEFCYECHEELLHNPVLLAEDIKGLEYIFKELKASEVEKSEEKKMIGDRIKIFHEIIAKGIEAKKKECS